MLDPNILSVGTREECDIKWYNRSTFMINSKWSLYHLLRLERFECGIRKECNNMIDYQIWLR